MPTTAARRDEVDSLSDLVDGLSLRIVGNVPHHPSGHTAPSSAMATTSAPRPSPVAKITPPPETSASSLPAEEPTDEIQKVLSSAQKPPRVKPSSDPRLRLPGPMSPVLRRTRRKTRPDPSDDPRLRPPEPVSVGRRARARRTRTTGAAGRPWRVLWWTFCGFALPLLENPPRQLRMLAAIGCVLRYLTMLTVTVRVLRRCFKKPLRRERIVTLEDRRLDKKIRAEIPPKKEVMAWEEFAPQRFNRRIAMIVLGIIILAALDVCVRLAADLTQGENQARSAARLAARAMSPRLAQ